MSLFGGLFNLGANLLFGGMSDRNEAARQRRDKDYAIEVEQFKESAGERRAQADFGRAKEMRGIDFDNTSRLSRQDYEQNLGLGEQSFQSQFKLGEQANTANQRLEELRQNATTNRLDKQLNAQRDMQIAGFDAIRTKQAIEAARAFKGLRGRK